MTEQLIVRDIEDTHTNGYMILSQHLGKIRDFCLSGKASPNLSPEEAFTALNKCFQELEHAFSKTADVFSGEEKTTIRAYMQQVKHTLAQPDRQTRDMLPSLLRDIYWRSTDLRASLGVFRVTINL
jgi:hypothetical protein